MSTISPSCAPDSIAIATEASVGHRRVGSVECTSRRRGTRQEFGLLVRRAVFDERRAHLPVGEPDRGDRRPGGDQLLADEEAVDRRLATATELGGPGHADPSVRRHLLGEFLGVAVDPRVVVPTEPLDGPLGDLPGLFCQRRLLGCPVEIHRT
jgi:hypothetical protein